MAAEAKMGVAGNFAAGGEEGQVFSPVSVQRRLILKIVFDSSAGLFIGGTVFGV